MIDTKAVVVNARLLRLRMHIKIVSCYFHRYTNQHNSEKDVTSINISAFAPGTVTCDFYTLVAFPSRLRSKLIQTGEPTAMETSTLSKLREESRVSSSASHSKLVA